MTRRVRARLSLALAAASVLGCARQQAKPPGGVLEVAVTYDAASLDPHLDNSFEAFEQVSNVYEPLLALDHDLRLVPGLAVSWTNPDPTTWSFRLRPGVSFHDGSPLRPEDVVYSVMRLKRDKTLAARSQLAAVTSAQVEDGEVVLRTERASARLLNDLSQVLIVPAGSTRETLEKRPNGTGPYAVASWEPRRRLGLRRHESYWGRLAPHSRVEVEMSVTEEQARAGLAAHRLSLIRTRSPGTLRAAEQSPRYRVARQMSLYLLHLGFNLSSPTLPGSEGVSNPFLRREVRQAIDIALDRGQIAAAASTNAVPTARIVPDSIFGSLPRGREAVWDLKRARGLLEGVGLGGGFDVALHSVYADPYPPIEELKAQLGKIGIRVRHVSFPSVPDFFAALRRRELGFWLIADGCMTGEAGWLLASQFHSADPSRNLGTDNYSGYSNPKLDEAIERADAILNARQRLPALQEAVSLAEEELLWIPLYHNEVLFVVDRALAFEPRHDLLLRYAEIGESSSR